MLYINNIKFAQEHGFISGNIDVIKSERIQELGEYTGVIDYKLTGLVDNLNRPTLKLQICGIISASCQNCLQPLEIKLDTQSLITIFYNEDRLDAALFGDHETGVADGVLADAEFNVVQLVEDEIIMSLPYAVKHNECLGLSYHDETSSPFNVLKKII